MHHHSNDIIQVMYGAWFSLELDIQAKKTIFISDKKFFSHQVETAHGGLSIVQQVCVLHAFYKLYFYWDSWGLEFGTVKISASQPRDIT